MSHRPKVPSTLKFLEGVVGSFLLSFELFHFLFLHKKKNSGVTIPKEGSPLIPAPLVKASWVGDTILNVLQNQPAYSRKPEGGVTAVPTLLRRNKATGTNTSSTATQRSQWPAWHRSQQPASLTTLRCRCYFKWPRRVKSSLPGPQWDCCDCHVTPASSTARTFPRSNSSSQSSTTVAVRAHLLSRMAS